MPDEKNLVLDSITAKDAETFAKFEKYFLHLKDIVQTANNKPVRVKVEGYVGAGIVVTPIHNGKIENLRILPTKDTTLGEFWVDFDPGRVSIRTIHNGASVVFQIFFEAQKAS